MFKLMLNTNESSGPFFTRLALGVVMFPHGAQKVLGWFGGSGYAGTVEAFTEKLGFPLWAVLLLMAIEVLGSIGLIAGFLTRLCALGTAASISVCAYLYHIPNGFFMNWLGGQKGEGIEYHILVLGICLALMIEGGGSFSLDRGISRSASKTSRDDRMRILV